VAGAIEQALAQVLRVDVSLTVAGRTDAGVHATGQVAHVDVPPVEDGLASSLLRRLAGVLPPDVRVTAIGPAPDGFDARFSALHRRYRYRIVDTPYGVNPLRRVDTLAWPRPLDVEAMASAAGPLVGEHDFVAFCRRREGATTIRVLQELAVHRLEDATIAVDVRADAFCHQMVRSLVGALLAVGEGRRSVTWPTELLSATARVDSVAVAPAHGLTLIGVGYPAADELAERALTTRARRRPLGE
jgi:tRNA pseudouridine38-40 synthase